MTVDTSVYHTAGANEVHDLGIALATALTYVKAGLDIDAACGQIAKLRAARKLWVAVAMACGGWSEGAW